MTNPSNVLAKDGDKPRLPGKWRFGIFLGVLIVTEVIVIFKTLTIPESYRAAARLMLVAREGNKDLDFSQLICSRTILDKAAEDLDLATVWGQRYFHGEHIIETEVLEILRHRLSISSVDKTSEIQIECYSDDPVEAAQIANAVASTFRDFSIENEKRIGGRNAETAHLPSVEFVEQARPPTRPCKPNMMFNIFLGLIFGAIAGAVAILLSPVPWWWRLFKIFYPEKIGGPNKDNLPQAKGDSPHPRIISKY